MYLLGFEVIGLFDKEFLNYKKGGRFINSLFYQQKLGIIMLISVALNSLHLITSGEQ